MKAATHRPTVAQVNLGAIERNIDKVRASLAGAAELWAVVKADAYGHGAMRVAGAVKSRVDGFCVSNLDEAIELRNSFIDQPILVLSGIRPQDAALARGYDLTLTAPSLAWLTETLSAGVALKGLKLHIKLDSGMGRIGVRTAGEANAMIAAMDAASVSFDGVFTHFATADEADDSHFVKQQRAFNTILSGLTRRPRYVHTTNSAAVLWHREEVRDIERLGIAMYGMNPSGRALGLPYPLEAALSLTSELSHVKEIPAGATIGYGATYQAVTPTVVGTVPIGYADGWSRDMQGFHVLVDGQFCEIIGRVSMDQLTIKLPRPYPLGTTVTLIGQDGERAISTQDVADWRHTITHEVLCGLTDRIPRKYIEE